MEARVKYTKNCDICLDDKSLIHITYKGNDIALFPLKVIDELIEKRRENLLLDHKLVFIRTKGIL